MQSILIRNAVIVNEGIKFEADVLIRDGHIVKIDSFIPGRYDREIDASGLYMMPGVIDDQVHFREPGFPQKASIYTESRAAVAGGITSYMEMPNTNPSTTTHELLEAKYLRASQVSLANYSFYLGASGENLEEIKKINPQYVCGLKIFMGSSTGSLLVNEPEALEKIFAASPVLIATHCEDDKLIAQNLKRLIQEIGEENLSAQHHPIIRDAEACFASSSLAVDLAKKHRARLHVLHISTQKELELFAAGSPNEKLITAEACIHHLWFCDEDYPQKGNLIKWNPAVKTAADRQAIWEALISDKIDVIATDHAPHTLEEKQQSYLKAPSGGPLVQHSLPAMLDYWKLGNISLEQIARKMAHSVADCFQIQNRGYIREGYWADLVLFNPQKTTTVSPESLLYKCNWSPFLGHTFQNQITHTIVSGHLAFDSGKFDESAMGKRLTFQR